MLREIPNHYTRSLLFVQIETFRALDVGSASSMEYEFINSADVNDCKCSEDS